MSKHLRFVVSLSACRRTVPILFRDTRHLCLSNSSSRSDVSYVHMFLTDFIHNGVSAVLTTMYFRSDQTVYPPHKDHCDQFCVVQRTKDRLCYHGFIQCPGCGNVYDGNAQCCHGFINDFDTSDESSVSDATDEWDSDIEIVAEIKKPLC